MIEPAAVRGLCTAAFLGLLLCSSAVAAKSLSDTAPAGGAAQAAFRMAQAGAANRPVSWSESQAARGEKLFKEICAACHGANLRGGLIGGPPLTGSTFVQKYMDGTPVSALVRLQQHPDAARFARAVFPAEYVELVAFILQENGIQSSGAPMPTNPAALDHMIVEK